MKSHLFTILHLYCLLFAAQWFYLCFPVASYAEKTEQTDPAEVKIGILALRGKEQCLKQWNATAEYLTKKIPGRTFTIIPLDFDEMDKAVGGRQVNFTITNSSMYVSLESHFGNTRIATMKTKLVGLGLTKFGGVIFCRSDRNDIQSVKDLPGKRFMAVDKKSFGGWQMSWLICLITKLILTRILKSLCSAAPTMWWCLPCLIRP